MGLRRVPKRQAPRRPHATHASRRTKKAGRKAKKTHSPLNHSNFSPRGNRLSSHSAREAAARSAKQRLPSNSTGGNDRVYRAPRPATCAA